MKYVIGIIIAIALYYIWNHMRLRRIFTPYAEKYGVSVGRIIGLYQVASVDARKQGIKPTPERFAKNALPILLRNVSDEDNDRLK